MTDVDAERNNADLLAVPEADLRTKHPEERTERRLAPLYQQNAHHTAKHPLRSP